MKQENIKSDDGHACVGEPHARSPRQLAPAAARDRAAQLFRAMGDSPRLHILDFLAQGECCVTELVNELGEKFPTVSQRLRILRSEGLVTRRRVGTHVFYSLADRHVAQLMANALAHAQELERIPTSHHTPEE